MNATQALLDLARTNGRRAVFVVGTGKNVGKTVVVRALVERAADCGLRLALASVGRDGESADVLDAFPKPRFFLRPGTIVATARDVLPRFPATELLEVTRLQSAAGVIVYGRVREAGYYELAGPPTASGIRHVVEALAALGCDQIIVDGAVDRLAALAGSDGAVVVATGAADAATPAEAVEAVRALVAKLRIPRFDPDAPWVKIEGALDAASAARIVAQAEGRQIVVRDPTQIAISGKAFLGIAKRLQLRCERPLDIVAVTVASIGRERYFEPREFARAIAQATHLPVFDLYAATMVAA